MLVRKTVTILFADVVDSTPLGESLDPEALRAVMQHWFDEMRACVERHGGTVEKFVGDEVMAVFGVPTVHADDAVRAVRAAAEMRERLAEVNRELEKTPGVRLAMRVGINTGEVAAGDPASGGTFVTGDPVVVGKRLTQAAEPGQILIGTATHALVRDAVVAGPLQRFKAKGKAAPAREIGSVEPGSPGLARRMAGPLVGRGDELAALRACYEEAVHSRKCRLVNVVGAAGIGKSRLAAELLRALREETHALTGRCLPYGESITFWPLVEIVSALEPLEELLRGEDDAALVTARARSVVGDAPAHATEETFWAVRRLVEVLARTRPVILCFEDVHWAEPTLLDLIEYLHGWTRDAPVVLLCLARPDVLERRPDWSSARERVDLITLEPLSAADAEDLLATVGTALPESARAHIARTAEGNPLFVEQMAAFAEEADDLTAVPPSIQALLGERLDRLPPPERAVLERASVIGRDFPMRAVSALVPDDARARVAGHLLELVRKGLVRPHVSSFDREDGFRFGHALIRDAAYSGMPKHLRAELHERVADWIEERGSRDLGEVVGHHLERAWLFHRELGRADEHARALATRASEALAAAGRRALARTDMRASASLLSRAADLLETRDARRIALLPDLISALIRTGAFDEAHVRVEEGIEAAAALSSRRLLLRLRIEREFLRSFTQPDRSVDEMRSVAEEAILELADDADESTLARAWWLLSEVESIACRWAGRANALERALAHARRAGDVREEETFIALLVQALYYGSTPVSDAIARCEEFSVATGGRRAVEAAVAAVLGGLRAQCGDFDDARRLCAHSKQLLDELGLVHRRAANALIFAEVELLAGDTAAAVEELRSAYDTLEALGEQGLRSTVAAYLARASLLHGRDDDAERFSGLSAEAAAEDDVVTQVVLRVARSGVAARRGDPSAEALARRAVELAEETDFPDLRAQALLALGGALRAAGRTAEAGEAADRARALYAEKGNTVAAASAALTGTI